MLNTHTQDMEMIETMVEEGYEVVIKEVVEPTAGTRVWKGIKSGAEWAFVIILFSHFVFTTLFGSINAVSGSSMDYTLANGQRLMTANNTENITYGDIVIAEPASMGDSRIVKRVIALEGDTIGFENGEVYLNGELLDEPYVNGDVTDMAEGEAVVPEGMAWIMGDNRQNSIDSRNIGFVSRDEITGKVILRYFPFAVFN